MTHTLVVAIIQGGLIAGEQSISTTLDFSQEEK